MTAKWVEKDKRTLSRYEQLVDEDDEVQALSVLAEAVRENALPELLVTFKAALAAFPDSEAAYQSCLKAAEKNDKSGPLQMSLGELAVSLDRAAEAIDHFEKAQELGESGADLYQLWAGASVSIGEVEQGQELFQAALEIAPDRVSEVYSAWGKSLCDAGFTRLASEKLTVAVAADDKAFYPHAYLGVVHLQEDRPSDAKASFERALALLPPGYEGYGAWIVQELAGVIEKLNGAESAAALIVAQAQQGRHSMALLERLRRLQGLTLGPRGKHFLLVVAGEDEHGDYYEECEAFADDEQSAFTFVKAAHAEKERGALAVADCKVIGRPQGSLAGLVEISEKTRVPQFAEAPNDEEDDDER